MITNLVDPKYKCTIIEIEFKYGKKFLYHLTSTTAYDFQLAYIWIIYIILYKFGVPGCPVSIMTYMATPTDPTLCCLKKWKIKKHLWQSRWSDRLSPNQSLTYIYLTKKEENGGRGGKNFEYEVKLSLIGCV